MHPSTIPAIIMVTKLKAMAGQLIIWRTPTAGKSSQDILGNFSGCALVIY